MNLDHIGLLYNFENGVITTNQECISELKKVFLSDIEGLTPITKQDWKNRSFGAKLHAYLIWPFRKLL
jgi:phosphatidylserine/phosphatidylglycerophosphate/cardiolipin synthase-like enzyme